MTKKRKKVPCFTEQKAMEMGVSQKTVQNLLRIGKAIELGLFPPDMVDDFKNDRISKSKMLEYLIQSKKGKEKLIFRVNPDLMLAFNIFKEIEGFESSAEALRQILARYLGSYFQSDEESSS
ncbi:MAG: hypothetical protein ACFE96_10540 [Candidatus Hermodarchaeota archaeon]